MNKSQNINIKNYKIKQKLTTNFLEKSPKFLNN